MRVVLLVTFTVFCSIGRCQEIRDSKVIALVNEAVASFILNRENVGAYACRYRGNHVLSVSSKATRTVEFSGAMATKDGNYRFDVQSRMASSELGRLGRLKVGDENFAIDGEPVDGEVAPVKTDELDRLNWAYVFDPFLVPFYNCFAVGRGSRKIGIAHCFLDSTLAGEREVDEGVVAVFALRKSKGMAFQEVSFSDRVASLPTRIDLLLQMKPGEFVREKCRHESRCIVVWEEVKEDIHLPKYVEMESGGDLEEILSVEFKWIEFNSLPQDYFSPEQLQSSHRRRDFALFDTPFGKQDKPLGKQK